jgi:FkbM family methyltransferase
MIRQSFTARRYYQTWGDTFSANWLRFTENRMARPLLRNPGSRLALHLRNYKQPILVRRSNSDFHVLKEVFEQGEYGPVLDMGLPADAKILDLGANIGLMAVYCDMHFPQCRLVSVEPDTQNCEMIRANCAGMLESGRMKLFQGFAAGKDGAASLQRDVMDGLAWSFQKVEAREGDSIPCYGVPTLCKAAGFDTIDLLKCDIEGSEIELFANCSDWIGKVRHLVVETHGEYGPPQLQEALRAAGWKFRVAFDRGYVIFLSAVD